MKRVIVVAATIVFAWALLPWLARLFDDALDLLDGVPTEEAP